MLFLFCALILGLNALVVLYLRSRHPRSRHCSAKGGAKQVILPSLSLETEPNRAPLPYNWKEKYVPIGRTTLEVTGAETWVKHKEDVPLPGYGRGQVPWDLRRQRIIFN